MHRARSSTHSHNRYVGRIAAKALHIVAQPFQRHCLVLEAKVAGTALVAGGQESKNTQSIGHCHQNHLASVHEQLRAQL